MRSYMQTMQTFQYYNSDDTNGLTLNEFINGYTIFAFDLTTDKDISASHRQGRSTKNLRLDLAFQDPTKTTINVLLYAVFDSSIEITKQRETITHYTR